ncbi:DEAD/DEAH box helicase [Candidatus Woesearchaeota archaeon]|nr:DEAD/DEAH box helicase [Candidatus Woesearchaeota archaeon]
MLKDFTPRLYQQTILGTAASKNTLVVLPTGLGKTALALLLAVQRLHHYPQSKILLLAPTKPLCEQHVDTFRKHLNLPSENITLFTGSVRPEKRAELWKTSQIIISTPQGLENDTINRRIRLEDVSLLVLDEAHHATGEYAYVWVAKQYEKNAKYSRILALTASPGSDLEKIKEVCQNLHIERVEVRTEKDPDVKPYIQHVEMNWIPVNFPIEFQKVQKILLDCKKSKLLEVQNKGYARSEDLGKSELLAIQAELHQRLSSGERDFDIMRSISLLAEALKIDHAIELIETQGIIPLHIYLSKLQQEALTTKVKAVQNLVLDPHFKMAFYQTQELVKQNIQHPKLIKLSELVTEQISHNKDAKIIIFTQFRDSAETIVQQLNITHIPNHIFVGQAKRNGLGFSQKEQKEILDHFRNGEFNVLIATSVAEEGLDIPKVDKVIFYEPVPSAIRSIQRRGRTGRLEQGEVTVLMTVKTRDEIYRWASHHKEKRMYRNLETLKKEFALFGKQNDQNATLKQYIPSETVVAVLADHREKNNRVVKELIDLGLSVKTAQLNSADYVISGTVGVELKKVPDFVASIIDGRLLDQARELKQNFTKAVIIIEGEEDLYSVRNIHPNAVRGMIASLALDFHIPIISSKNPQDTAALLAVMAKREQDKSRDFTLHDRKPKSMQEQMEFIVSSLPSIGSINAAKLLEHFGSLKNIVNASKEELTTVEGIGGKTAERLLQLFEEKYPKK